MHYSSSDFRSRGRVLLDQQMWCFGQDVLCPERNLLLEFGMSRTAPPKRHVDVPSIYAWQDRSCLVVLRGFGIGFRHRRGGQIFLKRSSFAPLLISDSVDLAELWTITDLESLRPQRGDDATLRAWKLASQCCRWIARYERWIAQTRGRDYRQAAIDRRTTRNSRWTLAEEMPSAWYSLARHCRQLPQDVASRAAG